MAAPMLQARPHQSQPQLGLLFAFRAWGASSQKTMRRVVASSISTEKKARPVAASSARRVWVWTQNKDVMTAAVEGGWNTFVFTPQTEELAISWKAMARINPLFLKDGQFFDTDCKQIGILGQIASGDEQDNVKLLVGRSEIVVMDALEWQIIPAENMVATFQNSSSSIFATAATAIDAKLCFEALEKGTDGVVLKTEDPTEVFALKTYLTSRQELENRVNLIAATVTKVEPVGMGDRVCVDLCCLLKPGEGLLVGSFARALFLVHSECLESAYVSSRPFRVNAGPVHAYVAMPGGRTSYLSELRSGVEVLVADETGQSRSVVVGRLKIESRPLILVEAEADSVKHSLLLQNAETVCLVRPADGKGHDGSLAISVAKLAAGDNILLTVQEAARHTGVQIQEFIVEK